MSKHLHDDPQRTTAIGMARYAHEFLEAAFAIDREIGTRPGFEVVAPIPALYLIGHGCELTLKAFLIHRGVDLKTIRSEVGHSLISAHKLARDYGLDGLAVFEEGEDGAFEILDDLYSTKQLEYIVTGAKAFPIFGLLERAAVRLFNPISTEVKFGKQFEGYAFLDAGRASPK